MGVYVQATYTAESVESLKKVFEGVPEAFTHRPHTTILYSKTGDHKDVNLRQYMVQSTLNNYVVEGEHLELWPTQNGKLALVLIVKSNYCRILNELLMKKYPELTEHYAEYIPHITISYDVPADIKLSDYDVRLTLRIGGINKDELDETATL